jgi:hypothetical protein
MKGPHAAAQQKRKRPKIGALKGNRGEAQTTPGTLARMALMAESAITSASA